MVVRHAAVFVDDRRQLSLYDVLSSSYGDEVGEKLDLVGVAEVAELLGISRQRVDVLHRNGSGLPGAGR